MKHGNDPSVSQLKGKRRYLFAAVLTIGAVAVVATALFSARKDESPEPAVHVPSMKNVPPGDTKMGVEVEKER